MDWNQVGVDLDAQGCAMLSGLLSADECGALAALYDDDARFRSRIVMSRHGFGRGEYKNFAYPLPEPIASLRPALLWQATKDAVERAKVLVGAPGGKLGKLRDVNVGVFQVTSPNSTDVSDYGVYDTSTLEKDVTAVVNVSFALS